MAKRTLSAVEAFELRQSLHVATLDALMASRRWEPGDLIFQGGTSLHLLHGSPRFSEDLDFLVDSSLSLASLAGAVATRLTSVGWIPTDTALTVSKFKQKANPHSFVVTIGGPEVIGAVRVKVELWCAERQTALAPINIIVAPVRLARGPASGMQTFVPTAETSEIFADKVFALAARPYLKPRDIFDLHWLSERGSDRAFDAPAMCARLAAYPNTSPASWVDSALRRKTALASSHVFVLADLKRWLPSSWPLSAERVDSMVGTAIASLERGIGVMQQIHAEVNAASPTAPRR